MSVKQASMIECDMFQLPTLRALFLLGPSDNLSSKWRKAWEHNEKICSTDTKS